MKKLIKNLVVTGIFALVAIIITSSFLYKPLNLWIRYSIFNDSFAMCQKAYFLFEQKKYEEARICYWKAYSLAKKKNNDIYKLYALHSLIEQWYQIKKYGVSIVAATLELKDFPDSPLALEYLGKNYDALKNYEMAYSYYIRYVPKDIINTKHEAKEVAQNFLWGEFDGEEKSESYQYDYIVFRLALFYTYGQGCSIDLQKAANLWQYLDNHKNSAATYNLALCYLNGDGVSQDNFRAFQLCKKAAVRGDKFAMKLLAKLYRRGTGCIKSEEVANHWQELAEETKK